MWPLAVAPFAFFSTFHCTSCHISIAKILEAGGNVKIAGTRQSTSGGRFLNLARRFFFNGDAIFREELYLKLVVATATFQGSLDFFFNY